MLLHCGGMQLQVIYFTLKGDLSKYDDAEKALTQYFQPSINVPFERHVFRNASQRDDETIEQFIKACLHYERGKKHSLFVLLIFFCACFNFNRSLQSKINKKETKNALFHARSGNGSLRV